MYRHPGASLVASAERRFEKLAIPNLIRWIAIFQFVVWALNLFVASGEGDATLVDYLILDQTKVFAGEVWRLFTFILIPRGMNPLIILFVVFFMWFIGDALEGAWGAFRVNLYVYATVACLIVLGLVPGIGMIVNVNIGFIFFCAMFLAFAGIYPEHVINLFGLIPIKAKWLAWADLAILASMVLSLPLMILPISAALFPYVVVFVPGFLHHMKENSQAATRRTAFQSEMEEVTGDAFHTCDFCGATDVSHPELEFRVTAEGKEICSNCHGQDQKPGEPAES